MANNPSSTHPKKHRLPAWVVGLGSAALALLVLFGATYGFYALSYRGEISPNTYIGGVSVDGLSPAAAEVLVTEQVRQFETTPLSFTIADTEVTIDQKELEVSYQTAASVTRAYEVGRLGTLWDQLVAQVGAVFESSEVSLVVDYSDEALDAKLDALSQRFDDPAVNASVEYERKAVVVTDETAGQAFDRVTLRADLVQAILNAEPLSDDLSFPLVFATPTITRVDVEQLLPLITSLVSTNLTLVFEDATFTVTPDQLTDWIELVAPTPTGPLRTSQSAAPLEGFVDSQSATMVEFSQDKIAAYAKTLAKELTQEPIDAKLTITNGKATVFQAAQDGRSLDETATVAAIVEELGARRTAARTSKPVAQTSIKLPVTVTPPTVTTNTVEDLGIQELIGTATTDFSGSPDNRVHNIGTGTKYLNGWLIKPGEEFSTVKSLGAVDGSTGYLPELVIKENRTIPEYGGGLCQVSTTLFRSVMNAGLPITERHQHSYRVSYYERGVGPGLDATIYLPRPDLRFKNDSPGWILVQGSVSGKTVTFELYGTKDGREVTIDGPHTLGTTSAPAAVYEQSSSLAPGQVKQIEKAHDGASTVATYTVKRGGEVINEQTFMSKYKALPARYLEGPKADAPPAEPAPAEPAPTETPAEPAPDPAP